MDTKQLIETLSGDVPRISRYALAQRIVLGFIVGGLITMGLVTLVFGVRPDLQIAMRGFSFWMKLTYTLLLGIGAGYGVTQLARPVPRSLHGLWLLTAPVLVMVGITIGELAHSPRAKWLAMWLGQSWMHCPWVVVLLAAPIFVGLVWSFKRLAPTRLRAAGAIGGFAAGAWAATIYCLHCPEASAPFVLTWYTLGIALTAGVGALLGPRLMRW